MRKSLLLATAFLAFTPSFAHASAPAFTDAQKAEIESIIKDYLINKHPEVMAEGLQKMQAQEQEQAEAKTKEAIVSMKSKVYDDPATPVTGNPSGDVTIVEFFDYQCGYCKMSQAPIEKLLKDDKGIRFINKEFPILGPVSTEASRAALASMKQGKYPAFHDAMLDSKDHLTSDAIYTIAKSVGIDIDRLKKDMNDPSIKEEIDATLKLGQDVGVRGTPMFIVNDTVYPGALQPDQLLKAVSDARVAGKKS